MFCPECGTKNEDNAVFCENCGTKLQDVQVAAPLETPEKKKGIHLDAGEKTQLIAIIAAVAAVILCFVVFNIQYSAEKTAKRYTEAVLTNDWNQLYDTLYVEGDGEFQNKEAFVTAMAMNESGEPQICNIGEAREANAGSGKAFFVSYTTQDDADVMEVQMKRKGLTWKVVTKDYTLNKYTISVPKGAKVVVDKVELDKSYKGESEDAGQDVYEISPVFGNTHYVEISGKGFEKTGKLVTGSKGEIAQVTASYDEKTVEKVTKQAAKDLQEILGGAASNKKFSDVEVLDEMEDIHKEDAVNNYEYVRDDVFRYGNSSYKFQKYEISNVEANSRVSKGDGKDVLEIIIKGNYLYEYQYKYWRDNTETKQYDGNCEHTLSYIKDGDDWELYNIDINI